MSVSDDIRAMREAVEVVKSAQEKVAHRHRQVNKALRQTIRRNYPSQRYAISTPERGRVQVRDRQEGAWVVVWVDDDGHARLRAGKGGVLIARGKSERTDVLELVSEGFSIVQKRPSARPGEVPPEWTLEQDRVMHGSSAYYGGWWGGW